MFHGKARLTEFVFHDDSLEMVWILADSSEDSDIRPQMRSALGEPCTFLCCHSLAEFYDHFRKLVYVFDPRPPV